MHTDTLVCLSDHLFDCYFVVCVCVVQGGGASSRGEQKEELENLRKQHELLKKMLEQQEQLRALQGRQAALLTMQHSAEHAIAAMDDAGLTHTHVFLHSLSYSLIYKSDTVSHTPTHSH